MSGINLSSGKREEEVRAFFRNPLVPAAMFIGLLVAVMMLRHPISDFIHEHHQFFYVSLTIGAIPFAFFVFVLYSQYGMVNADLLLCIDNSNSLCLNQNKNNFMLAINVLFDKETRQKDIDVYSSSVRLLWCGKQRRPPSLISCLRS
jgi:hypothetical protein